MKSEKKVFAREVILKNDQKLAANEEDLKHMQNCENNWKEVESSLNNFRIYASLLLIHLTHSLALSRE